MRALRRPWEVVDVACTVPAPVAGPAAGSAPATPVRPGWQHRCDACGAWACVHVRVGEHGALLLCGEHFRTHEATLDERGYTVSWGESEHVA
ncbi:DUF7455 domain-containing protein [Cellulosimicrobium cellulans]|uniref:DUF7455 domain-containing protein n=1 Tax=Cellulosimicrobium cellulans TaxID=1710 RepID=UPI000848593F|nr:hypothetical protein [Cellulosimicrobium cellulans]